MLQDTADSESKSTITVVQEVRPPLIPDDAHVMTLLINHPPGAPGYPPHRHPGGPAFSYTIDGEMLFELEGEAPRVPRAGDALPEPGGDEIHYQDLTTALTFEPDWAVESVGPLMLDLDTTREGCKTSCE